MCARGMGGGGIAPRGPHNKNQTPRQVVSGDADGITIENVGVDHSQIRALIQFRELGRVSLLQFLFDPDRIDLNGWIRDITSGIRKGGDAAAIIDLLILTAPSLGLV